MNNKNYLILDSNVLINTLKSSSIRNNLKKQLKEIKEKFSIIYFHTSGKIYYRLFINFKVFDRINDKK